MKLVLLITNGYYQTSKPLKLVLWIHRCGPHHWEENSHAQTCPSSEKKTLKEIFLQHFPANFVFAVDGRTFKRKFTTAISWAPAEKILKKNHSENNFQFLWAPAEPQVHSSLSSVAQFWQAALVGRERLVGGDVGHLLAVHHLHLLLHRSAACARQTQVELYFQPSPPVQKLLLSRVRMGKDERNHYQKQNRPGHCMF